LTVDNAIEAIKTYETNIYKEACFLGEVE